MPGCGRCTATVIYMGREYRVTHVVSLPRSGLDCFPSITMNHQSFAAIIVLVCCPNGLIASVVDWLGQGQGHASTRPAIPACSTDLAAVLTTWYHCTSTYGTGNSSVRLGPRYLLHRMIRTLYLPCLLAGLEGIALCTQCAVLKVIDVLDVLHVPTLLQLPAVPDQMLQMLQLVRCCACRVQPRSSSIEASRPS